MQAARVGDHQVGVERMRVAVVGGLDRLRAERGDSARSGRPSRRGGSGPRPRARRAGPRGRGCRDRRRGCSRRRGRGRSRASRRGGRARVSCAGLTRRPGRHRLVAALAPQGRGSRAPRRRRRRATAGGGGSPARSAASCPHAAPISAPRLRRIVTPMPAASIRAANASMTGIGLAVPGRVGDRVHRDQVDVREVAAQEGRDGVGIRVGVVHAADHRHLVADPPARRAGVVAAAATTSSTGQRRLSGTSTSRSASRAAWSEIASVNCGPSAVSRRMPGTTPDVETVMCRAPRPSLRRVVERRDGLEHAVEVEQRLAHAHEHDVREARRRPAPRRRDRAPHLVEDLRGLEVALEAQLAGRAERAADRAAGLARDAQRVPRAPARPAPGSASAPTRRSARRTAGGGPSRSARRRDDDRVVLDGRPAERVVDRGGQRPRQGRQARGAVAAPRPQACLELARPVCRLAALASQAIQWSAGHGRQPRSRITGRASSAGQPSRM